MRNICLLAVLTIICLSCEKDEVTEPIATNLTAKVLGEWEMYRDENLESIIDEWTGTEWTTKDQWFRNIREDSRIILEFKDDGTFVDRYADVPVANGVWGALTDNSFYFDYVADETNPNAELSERRYITFYCDNTYSVEIDKNEKAIYYYRVIGSIECSDEINYNVTD